MANLQVQSLFLYKPESSFANTFPDFSETITFFIFFKILEQLFSRLGSYYWVIAFSFFYKVFIINSNGLYHESHFACQLISNKFSVSKVGFNKFSFCNTNTKFSFCNHGREATFLKFCPLMKLLKGTARIWKTGGKCWPTTGLE